MGRYSHASLKALSFLFLHAAPALPANTGGIREDGKAFLTCAVLITAVWVLGKGTASLTILFDGGNDGRTECGI